MKKIPDYVANLVIRRSFSNATLPRPFHDIPGPKPLPLIGNIWRYLPMIGDYKLDQLYENAQFNKKKYGLIVREEITSDHTILHLFDPQDIKVFFRQDGNEPHRRSHRALLKYRRDNLQYYNDGGLFPENGPTWSRIRKLFHKDLMKKSEISKRAKILDEMALHAIKGLADRRVMENFENFLYEWSIKSSLAVFLDYGPQNLPDLRTLQALIKSLHDELEAIDGTEIKSEKWIKQPSRCPFYQKLSKAEAHLYSFVTERVDNLLKTNSMRPQTSFVSDWLLRDKLDRKDVIGFILDSILASIHTTVYSTTFLLQHISTWGAENQEELRRQINLNIPPSTQPLNIGIIDKLTMLKSCLRETLRLRPVSIGMGRLTQNEMVIRDYLIPSGVMVIAHNQTICMDPMIYDKPEQFCPARWAVYRNQSREEQPSPFAWLPYGFGPRACIGQRLANLQIQILAARLLQRFTWRFPEDIETKSLLVHTLKGGVKFELYGIEEGRLSS